MRNLILLLSVVASAEHTHAQFRPWLNNRYLKRVVLTASGKFNIPSGARRAYIRLWGAGGGAGGSSAPTELGGTGGGGGYVSADYPVSWLVQNNYTYLSIGQPGNGGQANGGVGRGGSGGSGTFLVQSGSQQNPILIAGGGAGGGGASGGPAGPGGAGGFIAGEDGQMPCASGTCPVAGQKAKGGISGTNTFGGGSAGPSPAVCSIIPPLTTSALAPAAGMLSTNTSYGTEGGDGGTCYKTSGTKTANGGNGNAWYDNSSSAGSIGCSGGAGGGGRAGGGGAGFVVNTGSSCGGGGGGAGYFISVGTTTQPRAYATGTGINPGYVGDRDLNTSFVVGGTVYPTVYATGGIPNGAGTGGRGTGGIAVIYFY